MTVTVASSDPSNNALQGQITAVQALVNAPTINPAINFQNLQTLAQLQYQLVQNLLANYQNRAPVLGQTTPAWINPATVLSTLTVNS